MAETASSSSSSSSPSSSSLPSSSTMIHDPLPRPPLNETSVPLPSEPSAPSTMEEDLIATATPSTPPIHRRGTPLDLCQQHFQNLKREHKISLKKTSFPLGNDNEIEGAIDWLLFTRPVSTTSVPPDRAEISPSNIIAFHPRRWYCGDKEANYRRLVSPNASEFRGLMEQMQEWSPCMFFIFLIFIQYFFKLF